MDYFYVGNHINNVGLQDAYLKGAAGLGNITVKADLHLFLSAAEIAADADGYLGTELDVSFQWKLDNWVSLGGGYSHLFASGSMELLKGGSASEIQNWAWLMLTVKPVFFSTAE
jgi:hypothetical protein